MLEVMPVRCVDNNASMTVKMRCSTESMEESICLPKPMRHTTPSPPTTSPGILLRPPGVCGSRRVLQGLCRGRQRLFLVMNQHDAPVCPFVSLFNALLFDRELGLPHAIFMSGLNGGIGLISTGPMFWHQQVGALPCRYCRMMEGWVALRRLLLLMRVGRRGVRWCVRWGEE